MAFINTIDLRQPHNLTAPAASIHFVHDADALL